MIPNERGRTAPPIPWMARDTISTPIDCANPASTVPAARQSIVTTSIRSLPTMSPTRPKIGVKIEADNKNAVSNQVTVLWDVCRSRWKVESTGTTRDCNSAYAVTASIRTTKVAR